MLSTQRSLLLILLSTIVCIVVVIHLLNPPDLQTRTTVVATGHKSSQSEDRQASAAAIRFINTVANGDESLREVFRCAILSTKNAANYCFQLKQHRTRFLQRAKQSRHKVEKTKSKRLIDVAATACEERGREDAIVMLKSVLIFGQESQIHAHVFTDNRTAAALGMDLMELKWTAEVRNWSFTFTLYMEWFPAGVAWRKMWQPCATQRLFFPSLLPHVDSLLYFDADMIVLSNLTEIWDLFEVMSNIELAAVAPNSEAPKDEPKSRRIYANPAIPFYGQRGLNDGFMLMNLTRMRRVDMESRALAAYQLYKDKISFADQDLYNIIFTAYPEWIYPIDCTYNFYWQHCQGGSNVSCVHDNSPQKEQYCFCEPVLSNGVRIIHGNMGTFHSSGFMKVVYEGFKKVDLLAQDETGLIQELQHNFDASFRSSCSHLTSALLYRNALRYLESV